MSDLPPVARPNYFDGEALLTADFVCEQTYHMDVLAALNRSLHIWGIASGLEVYWQHGVQSRQVRVSAGMAIDRLGREIILTSPKVVVLSDAEAGSVSYLTIRYDEAYADYTDQTGVPGYKRIVQQPKIDDTRSLPDPGLNILLAVVSLSSEGAINALTYRAGTYERRYAGGRFGQMELVIPGSGIGSGNGSEAQLGTMIVSAQLEAAGAYLAFEAGRSRFNGALSIGGNLGIGIDHPDCNLQISSPVFEGPGVCTSNGTTLFLSKPISPPLRRGDAVVPQIAIGTAPPKPAWGVIAAATEDAGRYVLEQAFSPNLVLPYSYTFLRGIVARITAPVGDPQSSPQDLLRIERGGTVALGMPSMPESGIGVGAAALQITTDRRVGIGLAGAPLSAARLEVNGDIQASGLSVAGQILARGPVKAQSFEGNGAKLQNLPILSYWTKVDPTSDYSPIYYASGPVCVQTKTPLGALSVGTGRAFVGSGLVTASTTSADKMIGNQTRFRDQVNPGDTIVVGTLRQLRETVSQVISDTELTLETQFPVLMLQTPYTIVASGKTGPGLMSGNGTRILGTATTFTKDFKPGDMLQVDDFVPNRGDAAEGGTGWMVEDVVSDAELVLIPRPDGSKCPANLSAFMMRPSLMGHFRDSNPVSSGQTLNKPALLVVSNAMLPQENGAPPNTLAINYELSEIDPSYALMVNGPTNFSGGGHFDDLSVGKLTVTDKAIVGGPLNPASLYRLQVSGGDFRVDQSVSVGASLNAQTVSTTGDVTATGSLSGSALKAAGVTVHKDGSVGLFGTVSGGKLTSTEVKFSATTDGFVVTRIEAGTNGAFGMLNCVAGTRTHVSTAATIVLPDGKDKYKVFPQASSMTVPVKKGEHVRITLSNSNNVGGWYDWVPLGPTRPGVDLDEAPVPETVDPIPDFNAIQPQLIRVTAAEHMPSFVQRFTDALATVAGKTAPQDVLRSMSEGVFGLTCAVQPDGPAPGSIYAVVENGMRILGATPTDEQKAQLAQGIAGLVDAPFPEARARVEQFLDDLQLVMGTTLNDGNRRRLRVALLRMVGVDDGPDQP